MSYTIPSDVESKIDAIIANGRFNSAEEVIRKAVEALAEREAFVAEVNASFVELEAGGGILLDDHEAELQTRRRAFASPLRQLDDLAAIREGIADLEAGRFTTLDEFDAEMRAKHGFLDGN